MSSSTNNILGGMVIAGECFGTCLSAEGAYLNQKAKIGKPYYIFFSLSILMLHEFSVNLFQLCKMSWFK